MAATTVVYQPDFNFVGLVCQTAITISQGSIIGQTQKERSFREGERRGLNSGLAESLALYGTKTRVDAWPPFVRPEDKERQWIPGISKSDAQEWLRQIIAAWKAGDWNDKSEEKFYGDVERKFYSELVFPEDVVADMDTHHRKNVRDGYEMPTTEDREWLQEELQAHKEMLEPYMKLMKLIEEAPSDG